MALRRSLIIRRNSIYLEQDRDEYRQTYKNVSLHGLDETEICSIDQLYKICKIAKRSALYLIQHGIIPVTDTGKQTLRYKIALDDVITYKAVIAFGFDEAKKIIEDYIKS